MEILRRSYDFVWYKKRLDVARKYPHKHEYEPKEYPCKVHSRLDNVSDYSSSSSATDIYYHTFIYQEEQKCEKCGHTETVWPSKQVDEVVDE